MSLFPAPSSKLRKVDVFSVLAALRSAPAAGCLLGREAGQSVAACAAIGQLIVCHHALVKFGQTEYGFVPVRLCIS